MGHLEKAQEGEVLAASEPLSSTDRNSPAPRPGAFDLPRRPVDRAPDFAAFITGLYRL